MGVACTLPEASARVFCACQRASNSSARAALLANPSLIKRPVVDWGPGAAVTTGFDATTWKSHVV